MHLLILATDGTYETGQLHEAPVTWWFVLGAWGVLIMPFVLLALTGRVFELFFAFLDRLRAQFLDRRSGVDTL